MAVAMKVKKVVGCFDFDFRFLRKALQQELCLKKMKVVVVEKKLIELTTTKWKKDRVFQC